VRADELHGCVRRPSKPHDEPLAARGLAGCAVALAIGSLGVGKLWIGLAGIMLFGIAACDLQRTMQAWAPTASAATARAR
jgi:hypothetical protein